MKTSLFSPTNARRPGRNAALKVLLLGGLAASAACQREADTAPANPSPAAATYRADVVQGWLTVQLRLARTTPVTLANTLSRPFGYGGIAAYEAVAPGLPSNLAGNASLASRLNGLTGLPSADPSLAYCWPLSANAALAAVNRALYANTSAANKTTIDSLETATAARYQAGGVGTEVAARSADFGRKVAAAVVAWAATDGFDNSAAYVPATAPGAWVPTPPAFAPAAFPNWGSNRPLVAGSGDGADPGPPPAYSAVAGTPFYQAGQEVYDVSQALTPDQRAIALFWNDVPNGRSFTPPGHWISILSQVLTKENPALDRALVAYAKVGISLNDASISCFRTKYQYSVLRPVSYVRAALGHPAWLSLIPTPNFPEYTAGHATVSGAAAEALTSVFGPNYAFTDQGYVPFGLAARAYASFEQAGTEAGLSRLYGGIHYRVSCERGGAQGRKVAQNINAKLKL